MPEGLAVGGRVFGKQVPKAERRKIKRIHPGDVKVGSTVHAESVEEDIEPPRMLSCSETKRHIIMAAMYRNALSILPTKVPQATRTRKIYQ